MRWRICASSINLPTIWPLSASSMCPSGALAIKPSGNFTCLPALKGFHSVLLRRGSRSEEHTSELQSLMRISYAVFCLKKKKKKKIENKVIKNKLIIRKYIKMIYNQLVNKIMAMLQQHTT